MKLFDTIRKMHVQTLTNNHETLCKNIHIWILQPARHINGPSEFFFIKLKIRRGGFHWSDKDLR